MKHLLSIRSNNGAFYTRFELLLDVCIKLRQLLIRQKWISVYHQYFPWNNPKPGKTYMKRRILLRWIECTALELDAYTIRQSYRQKTKIGHVTCDAKFPLLITAFCNVSSGSKYVS